MNESSSINANSGPAATVFPPTPVAQAPVLGIVMLDTRFPRPVGDVGNAATWAVPVNFNVVRGVWPERVVQSARGLRAGRVTPAFLTVVRNLQKSGVAAITTSCGFLVLLQKELQAAVKIPVATSSLLLLPRLLAVHEQVGVLTISATALGAEHLRSAGVPRDRVRDVLVQGVAPQGAFAGPILGNLPDMDLQGAGDDVVAAALALKARAPHLRALVLECTNMPPHARRVREATGWDVLTLYDLPALKPYVGAWEAAA